MTADTRQKNKEFESHLRSACETHLKNNYDVDTYVLNVINDMSWGENEPLHDETGTEYYHEIGSFYTKSGNPHVVSCPWLRT